MKAQELFAITVTAITLISIHAFRGQNNGGFGEDGAALSVLAPVEHRVSNIAAAVFPDQTEVKSRFIVTSDLCLPQAFNH